MNAQAFHPKHILAPVDFSSACLHGVTAAIDLARRFGARLTLIHVVKHYPHGSHIVLEAAGLEQDFEKAAREKLAEFAATHVPKDRCVHQVVTHGKPFHEIVKRSLLNGSDLIVMASHGHTDLGHVLIGSTTERVVQHAHCPVLVVPGRSMEPASPSAWTSSFHHVLVTTDFSKQAASAYPFAITMAKEYKAKLTLMHVAQPMTPAVGPFGEILPIDTSPIEEASQRANTAALRKLTETEFSECKDLAVAERIGRPAVEICEFARQQQRPTLIVIATHGTSGWQHTLLGSVAERVVRHAPCPVLVVRCKRGD